MEILNPDQNENFIDFYLDFGFDFSECVFICTANTTENLLAPLLDRIEIINIDPYLPVEKLHIASDYLLPRLFQQYNLNKDTYQIEFTQKCLQSMIKGLNFTIFSKISDYCAKEAGVRALRKNLDKIIRKLVLNVEQERLDSEAPKRESEKSIIESSDLESYLDSPAEDYSHFHLESSTLPIGNANGLAYIDEGYGTSSLSPSHPNRFIASNSICEEALQEQ